MLRYKLIKKDELSKARLGEMNINGTIVNTPIFMPVGTKASVKTLSSEEINEINDGIVLANTYHLLLSPGVETLNRNKGVKNFMNYHNIILTDSGGFQVFSLSDIRTIKEEGVYFKNPKNGDSLFISPEESIRIQNAIGSDIIMSFDECIPINSSYEYTAKSVERTTRWALRCKEELNRLNSNQILFGINQGGLFKDLRAQSAKELVEIDFPGYSIGGLSVGESKKEMYEITSFLDDHLPKDKPRYLMGVGAIDDILENVLNGIDMFDCVLPSRNSRHGMFYSMQGHFNIKQERFSLDDSPLDELLNHKYSKYKKSYIRHLFKEGEMLAFRILTYHNLMFMKYFMNLIREHIKNNTLLEFRDYIKNNTNFYKK